MNRGGKWAVTLSIDGFRLIGAQDPDYVGQDGPFWVPAPDATWTDIPPPGPIYAAKVGIKHRNGTVTWGVARFKDYATGAMWDKFPSTMSAKCAEMLAWRKAFPGRLGGLYGVEEMEQAGFKAKAAPEDAPPPAPVVSEEDVDSVKNKYLIALNGAKSREELRGIGQQITKDQALTHAAVMELHLVYTDKVKAYAAR
jgi:hypothetical protein